MLDDFTLVFSSPPQFLDELREGETTAFIRLKKNQRRENNIPQLLALKHVKISTSLNVLETQVLSSFLPHSLISLDLSFIRIEDFKSIAVYIGSLYSLENLSLAGLMLTNEDYRALATSLRKLIFLKHLDLHHNNDMARHLNVIREMDLSEPAMTIFASVLGALTCLESLNLLQTFWDFESLKILLPKLSQLPRFKSLGLSLRDDLTEVLKELENFPFLETLEVSSPFGMNLSVLNLPKTLKNLHLMGLTNTDFDLRLLAQAVATCPELRCIQFRRGIGDYSGNELRALTEVLDARPKDSLEVLGLSNVVHDYFQLNVIGPVLEKFIKLRTLNISGNNADLRNIGDVLRHLNMLESLDLSYNRVLLEGALKMAPVFETLEQLSDLNLQSTELGAEGVASLAPSFEKLIKLKKLNLSFNKIGDDIGALALNRWLPFVAKSLETLKLASTSLSSASFIILAPAFGKLVKLKDLELGGNNLEDSQASMALAEALENLTLLQRLDLSTCKLGPHNLLLIASKFEKLSKTLEILELRLNALGSTSVDVFTTELVKLERLRELHLGVNSFSGQASVSIVTALQKLQFLNRLEYMLNVIDEEEMKLVAPCLGRLEFLNVLYLDAYCGAYAVKLLAYHVLYSRLNHHASYLETDTFYSHQRMFKLVILLCSLRSSSKMRSGSNSAIGMLPLELIKMVTKKVHFVL